MNAFSMKQINFKIDYIGVWFYQGTCSDSEMLKQ